MGFLGIEDAPDSVGHIAFAEFACRTKWEIVAFKFLLKALRGGVI